MGISVKKKFIPSKSKKKHLNLKNYKIVSPKQFGWEEMCRVQIPVPKMDVQKAIVTIYHTMRERKKISRQLKELMKPLCPALMRGVVEEMEEKEEVLV